MNKNSIKWKRAFPVNLRISNKLKTKIINKSKSCKMKRWWFEYRPHRGIVFRVLATGKRLSQLNQYLVNIRQKLINFLKNLNYFVQIRKSSFIWKRAQLNLSLSCLPLLIKMTREYSSLLKTVVNKETMSLQLKWWVRAQQLLDLYFNNLKTVTIAPEYNSRISPKCRDRMSSINQ